MTPWGRYKKLARTRSIDGIEYIEFKSTASKGQKKHPRPDENDADTTIDLDESVNVLDDLSVDSPKRGDPNHACLSASYLRTGNTGPPDPIEFFPLATLSFYCLHAHTPERGPPSLA